MQLTPTNSPSTGQSSSISAYQLLNGSTYYALRSSRLRHYNREVEIFEQKYLRIAQQFEADKNRIIQNLKTKVWRYIEEAKTCSSSEFDYFFIGVKGECFKEFKIAQNQFIMLESELRDTIYNDVWLSMNKCFTKSDGLKKENLRALKRQFSSKLKLMTSSLKEDKIHYMMKFNNRINQYLKHTFSNRAPLFDQFKVELTAEIFAITRETH